MLSDFNNFYKPANITDNDDKRWSLQPFIHNRRLQIKQGRYSQMIFNRQSRLPREWKRLLNKISGKWIVYLQKKIVEPLSIVFLNINSKLIRD